MENFNRSLKIVGLAGLLFFIGCGEPKLDSTTNPYSQIWKISHHHRGLKEFRRDRDFDGDGFKDHYAVMNDGTIYTNYSSELVEQIKAGVEKPFWTWYKVGD